MSNMASADYKVERFVEPVSLWPLVTVATKNLVYNKAYASFLNTVLFVFNAKMTFI